MIPTNSPVFEHVYVANQRCECGGYFATQSQELRMLPSGPVDRLVARCDECGAERAFDFDISSFFGHFERYDHFRQVDGRFREAMHHLRAGRLAEAEQVLRLVVDSEEGEPAFAWGHYHLGMILLLQNRPEEALVHLEQAVAIQPLEPDLHEGIGRAHQAMGHEEEAQRHFRRGAELREQLNARSASENGANR